MYKRLDNNFIFHFLSILFISLCICFIFFVVFKYSYFPWWHRIGNDRDGTQAAINIALLNDSRFLTVHHPGATISNIHGIVYKILAVVDKNHSNLFKLAKVKNYDEVDALLETATRTSRYLVLITNIGFFLILYGLLFKLTKNKWITFFFSFYIILSQGHIDHLHMLRPEVLSVLFFLTAIYLTLYQFQKNQYLIKSWIIAFTIIGFSLSFSVFSKVQIVPAVLIFVVGISFLMLLNAYHLKLLSQSTRKINAVFLLLNIIIFPWWTFKKPLFMTQDFWNKTAYVMQMQHIYPKMPDNFLMLPMIFFGGCFCILLLKNLEIVRRLHFFILTLSSLILGFSLATYYIFLPISVSLTRYFENTQNLVYTLLVQMCFASPLENKGLGFYTIKKIISRLSLGDLLFVNLFYLIVVFILLCLFRLFKKDTENKKSYAFVLSWFFLAFIMDLFSTMRGRNYYAYYFIYTITFNGIGIAYCLSLELSKLKKNILIFKKYEIYLRIIIGLFISSFIIQKCYFYITMERSHLSKLTNRYVDLNYTRLYAAPFWWIVDENLAKNYLSEKNKSKTSPDLSSIEEISRQIQMDVNNPKNYYLRANIYQLTRELDKAISDYSRAIELDSNNSEYYFQRALVYKTKEDFQNAIRDYARVIDMEPNSFTAYFNRANIYGTLKKNEEALSDYNKTIDLNPQFSIALVNRGNIYLQNKQYDLALEDYSNAIKTSPELVEAYNNRAFFYFRKGELTKAQEDYNKVIELQPKNGVAYFRRAFLYFIKEDYKNSWKDVKLAQQLGYQVDPLFIYRLQEAEDQDLKE